MSERPLVEQKNYKRNAGKGLVRIVSTLVAFTATLVIAAHCKTLLGAWVALGVAGFIMAGFYSAMHYLSHESVFETQPYNRGWGLVFAAILLQNFSLYKYFHLKHHQFTGVDGDSEPSGELKSFLHYIFYALNWDYFVAFLRMSVMSVFGYYPEFVSKKAHRRAVKIDAGFQLAVILAASILTVIFPLEMLTLYWIPLQLAMSLNFFLALGEHYGCERTRDPLRNTRCFGLKNASFEWFHWNANYHAEHHLFPRATPWSLAHLHAEFGSHFEFGPISYVSLNANIARNLLVAGKFFASPDLSTAPDFFYPLTKTE